MAYSTLSSAETQKIFEQRTMITHSRDPSEKNPTPEGARLWTASREGFHGWSAGRRGRGSME